MIYVENDFYSNFSNAVKSDDDIAIQNMLVDQISSLIAKRRGELIEMLQTKVGLTLTKNPTNEELSNVVVGNLRKSKKLQRVLAYLIAKQNGILDVSEKSNRTKKRAQEEEGGEQKEKTTDAEKTANTVASIANTIATLADTLKEERASKFKIELQRQSNRKAPNYSVKAYTDKNGQKSNNKKKKKSKKMLLIGLGVIAVAGIAYYGYKKGWFKGMKKASDGGAVGGADVGGTPSGGVDAPSVGADGVGAGSSV